MGQVLLSLASLTKLYPSLCCSGKKQLKDNKNTSGKQELWKWVKAGYKSHVFRVRWKSGKKGGNCSSTLILKQAFYFILKLTFKGVSSEIYRSWWASIMAKASTGMGFPGGLVVKNPPANAGDARDSSSIPGLGRSPGGGSGYPLQHPCLEKIPWTQEPGRLVHGDEELDTTEHAERRVGRKKKQVDSHSFQHLYSFYIPKFLPCLFTEFRNFSIENMIWELQSLLSVRYWDLKQNLQYLVKKKKKKLGSSLKSLKSTYSLLTLSFLETSMCAKLLQLCLILCGPMDPPGSVPGILQARILEWAATPFSRGSSPLTNRSHASFGCCTAEPLGEALLSDKTLIHFINILQ